MKIFNKTGSFFDRPGLTTNILLAVNFAVFALCYFEASQPTIPGSILYAHGALYKGAIVGEQYWRLLAAGFLHADPLHLALNMICLVSWGGLLERRVGAFNFTLIYFCSLIAGSLTSILGHPTNFIGVGASGAISGILGALLCLFILGKINLSGQFFVGAIGLNVVLMASVPRIDWWGHLGGFTAGLICCAVLDLFAKLNNVLLRCKFPEFVKFDLALSAALIALMGTQTEISGFPVSIISLSIAILGIALVMIKLVDLLLNTTRGLAIIVIGFAVFYACVPLLLLSSLSHAIAGQCASAAQNSPVQDTNIARMAVTEICRQPIWLPYLLSVLLLSVTMIVHRAALMKGLRDVGFVGAGLRADRHRCQGI
jgi:membrane associated rhomboid family serine protease